MRWNYYDSVRSMGPLPHTGTPSTTSPAGSYYLNKTCHGCQGSGWVEIKENAVLCPVCGGKGTVDNWPYYYPHHPYEITW